MNKLIVIEVGSTVTKAFLFENDNTTELPKELVEFKKHYVDYNKILEDDENKLFNYINKLKEIADNIYIYGTSIFRNISSEEKEAFLEHLKASTGLTLTVASASDEERYTINGVIANIDTTKPIVILIGGGGSNEIAVVKDKEVIERLHINMGAVDINVSYPDLARDRTTIDVGEVIKELETKLIDLKTEVDVLVLAGSSNKFFRETVGYHFTEDVPFKYDKKEMVVMTKEACDKDDNDYYYNKSLEEMKKYTPDMPNWWVPSRALIAFAAAVSNKCKAKYIAASNIGMTYGIAEEKRNSN